MSTQTVQLGAGNQYIYGGWTTDTAAITYTHPSGPTQQQINYAYALYANGEGTVDLPLLAKLLGCDEDWLDTMFLMKAAGVREGK